jgi:hypothetical protein
MINQSEQWERPDREAVIRDNPLLPYCQERGWKLRRAGREWMCLCPLHEERTPSFSINPEKNIWFCHGCKKNGNVIDLHAAIKGISGMETLCDLAGIEYHRSKSSSSQAEKKDNTAKSQSGYAEAYDPFKDPEKARKRQGWPAFEVPTNATIETIAALRSLSPEGVALAAQRGLLFCADSQEGRAWIITDSRYKNAQARRLDGNQWERIGGKKAWTLPGSIGALPIGLHEAKDFPNIALVEGGPDLLAAFHLAWCATSTPETLAKGKGVDVLGTLGIVAMFGTHDIPEEELTAFRGKRVRIFADADKAGQAAKNRWWHQLRRAGAKVDSYSFTGFVRFDGKPVKDLNDFALIGPDQWETDREAIEEAFSFSN